MSVDERYLQHVLRTLSHDLGGAVRAASGFSELLLQQYEHSLDDKAVKWLRLTKQEGDKARQYLDVLSRYARLYGLDDSKKVVCDLMACCQQVMRHDGYTTLVQRQPLFSVELGELPMLYGHVELWQQYFLALLMNSAVFSVKDQPVVCRVYAERLDDMLRIVVEDNGVGLSSENLAKAMLPFRSLASGSADGGESCSSFAGMGVGLSVAKRIVEAHDGWFSVESSDADPHFFRVIATVPNTPL